MADELDDKKSGSGDQARLILVMALMMLLIFAWPQISRYFAGEAPTDPAKTPDPARTENGGTPGGDPDKPPADALMPVKPTTPAVTDPVIGAERIPDTEFFQPDRFRYAALLGGDRASLAELRLSEFNDRVRSLIDLTDRQPKPMPLMVPAGAKDKPVGSFEITRLVVDGKPVALGRRDWDYVGTETTDAGAQRAVFRMTVERGGKAVPLVLEKVFTARPIPGTDAPDGVGYLLDVGFRAKFADKLAHNVEFDFTGPVGVPEETHQDIRKVVWGERDRPTTLKRHLIGYDTLTKAVTDRTPLPAVTVPAGEEGKPKDSAHRDAVAADKLWYAGVMNRFFAVLVVPTSLEGSRTGAPVGPTGIKAVQIAYFPLREEPITTREGAHVFTPLFTVAADIPEGGGTWERGFHVYAGPKKKAYLDAVTAEMAVPAYMFDNLIDYAQFGCCFGAEGSLGIDCSGTIGQMVGLPLLNALDWMARWLTFGNYGVAIILLVLLVRVVMYPISRKSTLSMLRMKEIQPKLAELQAKYADDKEQLGRKTMELYQKEGVNPVSGCLPMLIQMPIWIGLWGALSAAVNLRHSGFVFWINDLAGEDALVHFAEKTALVLPLCGTVTLPSTLNVLPLLMAIFMFAQQKIMTPQQAPANPDQQPIDPKMMMYMMTGMFLLMLYSAPAGLNLYIMTSTIFGLLEHRWVKNHYQQLKDKGLLEPKPDAKPGLLARLMAKVHAMQDEADKLKSGKDEPRSESSGGGGGGKKKKRR